MTQDERLNLLKNVVDGFAKIMNNDTEIVLHDLEKLELTYIANGNVTNRRIGYKMDETVLKAIISMVDDKGQMIGYGSQSVDGTRIRASHILFYDEEHKPAALICVNQDMTRLDDVIRTLEDMMPLTDHASDETPDHNVDYIQKVAQKAVIDAMRKISPNQLQSREGKMELLRDLRIQGVFDVKDMVPFVCSALSISQATLYNYLRDLRESEREPIDDLKVIR